MKESFNSLYTRLYRENFDELEKLREKSKKNVMTLIYIVIGIFVLSMVIPYLIVFLFPVLIVYVIIMASKSRKTGNINQITIQERPKNYVEVFKEKIVGPIIENTFEAAKYTPHKGISRYDYDKAGYKEHYDRYSSEDLILAPFKPNKETTSLITIAEVHTEHESRDSDGDRTYVTVFRGLVSSFILSKDISKRIYIRSNGRVSSLNKNRIKMDMSEFEKIFDVESEDAILTMRILTSDVMAEMIDLYQKYKYKFEISIIKDTIYMRLRTGGMFEPNVFKSSMEYKTLERYYTVLKAMTSIATHIYETISKLEV